MDIVGTVAIVEVSPYLDPWKRLVGQAVLQVNRNVKTVLAKAGVVEGEYRLRQLEVIAGTGDTAVIHREYGCKYYVDPRVVYFSPRLSEERQRIARQVQAGETINGRYQSKPLYTLAAAATRAVTIEVTPGQAASLSGEKVELRLGGKVFPGTVQAVIWTIPGEGTSSARLNIQFTPAEKVSIGTPVRVLLP